MLTVEEMSKEMRSLTRALLAGLPAFIIPVVLAIPPRAAQVDAALVAKGSQIYEKNCKQCHLKGGNSRVKRLRLADDVWRNGGSLEEIQKTIREGVDSSQMEGFKDQLSAEEIEAVAHFVKSLSAPGAE
jgi:cbb3-type cytochrome c oxidase subunit III